MTSRIWIALLYCGDSCKEELYFVKIILEKGIWMWINSLTPDCIASPKVVPLDDQKVVLVLPKRLSAHYQMTFEETGIFKDSNPGFFSLSKWRKAKWVLFQMESILSLPFLSSIIFPYLRHSKHWLWTLKLLRNKTGRKWLQHYTCSTCLYPATFMTRCSWFTWAGISVIVVHLLCLWHQGVWLHRW